MCQLILKLFSELTNNKRRNGFSLIELMVVMSLIGLSSGMAAVYIGKHDTDLRKSVMNLNFTLKNAKAEAANRNRTIQVVFVAEEGELHGIDFTGDGFVDENDEACYLLLCEECEGANLNFQGKNHLILNTGSINSKFETFVVTGTPAIIFSPFGETSATERNISAYTKVPTSVECSTGCQPLSYSITINRVGGILTEKLDDLSCVDQAYCNI